MRITALNIHPVKSTAIRPLTSMAIDPDGPRDDRSWMIVDADGELVSAREIAALFTIVADTVSTDASVTSALRLRSAGHPDLTLEHPTGSRTRVTIFGRELEGVPAGSRAEDWLRAVLGQGGLQLVWCGAPSRRALPPGRANDDEHSRFTDTDPVTLGSEASLAQLHEWIRATAQERGEDPDLVPMQRFRPNIVIDGDEPFAEDSWASVQVGDLRLRVIKPVDRCVMTMIDPGSLTRGKEPLRTLARHRKVGSKTLFCTRLIPETAGTISVGDEVLVA